MFYNSVLDWVNNGKPFSAYILGDCMEGMQHIEDKSIQLAIADPPYGIGDFRNSKCKDTRDGKTWRSSKDKYKKVDWNEIIPNKAYFDELYRVSKNHIIFGFQHYIEFLDPASRGVIIHDFKDNNFNMSHADCAITNLQKRVTVFKYLWNGFKKDFKERLDYNRIHPCEKPLALYKWLLKNYAKPGDIILDTHVGSASSLIACIDMGFEYVGFELDPDYYAESVKRINRYKSQLKLFGYDYENNQT